MGKNSWSVIILVSHLKMWIHFNYIPSGLIYTHSAINRKQREKNKKTQKENRRWKKINKKNKLVSLSIVSHFDFDCAEIICNRFSFCLLYLEYTAETISSHFPNPFYLLFSFSTCILTAESNHGQFFFFDFSIASTIFCCLDLLNNSWNESQQLCVSWSCESICLESISVHSLLCSYESNSSYSEYFLLQ